MPKAQAQDLFDDGYIYTAGSSGHFTAINVDDPTNPFITDYYGVSRYRTLGIDIQDSLIMLISDDSLVTYKDAEPHTTKVKTIDFSKAIRDLGHNPEVLPEEGIKKTVEWMKDYYKMS